LKDKETDELGRSSLALHVYASGEIQIHL
jgi:hypothetical protein